jgi:hypothetical protein
MSRSAQNVIGEVYDSSMFTHVKERKEFVGELSTTPAVLRQLWNDSMDLGFGIRSAKTGAVVYFTLHDLVRDSDGDLVKLVFEPFRPSAALDGYRVHIFNT